MSLTPSYAKFLNIVDNHIGDAIRKMESRGRAISCGRGCSACCYMMVEVSWDEAVEMARWIESRPSATRARMKRKISRAAAERRSYFSAKPSTARYARPTTSSKDLSIKATNEYFYSKSRPCPLLEDGVCSAYAARPTACRLHMVTTDPLLCSRKTGRHTEVVIPKEADSARRKIERISEKVLLDDRWGELSIMVDYVLKNKEF